MSNTHFEHSEVLLQDLYKLKYSDVIEIIQYCENCGIASSLNVAQFDEIFSPYFSSMDEVFDELAGDDPEVDGYEMLILFILGCQGHFKWKILYLFSIFDFDQSGDIDKEEFILIVSLLCKVLSKLSKVKPINDKKIRTVALTVFKLIDLNDDRVLDPYEILTWAENEREVQEFIAQLTGSQDICLTKLKYYEALNEFMFLFKEGLDRKEFTSLFMQTSSSGMLSKQELDCLLNLIFNNSRELTLFNYSQVIQQGTSYLVGGGNKILVRNGELRTIITLDIGEVPDLHSVQRIMHVLDKDSKGYITVNDGLLHMKAQAATAQCALIAPLQVRFLSKSCNRFSPLATQEVKSLLEDFFIETIQQRAQLISEVSGDIVDSMPSPSLCWVEFQQYLRQITEKLETCKEVLKNNY